MYDTCNHNQSTCINAIQVAVNPREFSTLTSMYRKTWYRRPDDDDTGRPLGQISSSMTGRRTAGAEAWVL